MRNKVTFNARNTKSQREKITYVLGLLPTDIVSSKGLLPDVRVIGSRGLIRSFDITIDTLDRCEFDLGTYNGRHSPLLVDYYLPDERSKFMSLTVQGEKNSVVYIFEVHDRRNVDILPNGDYALVRRSLSVV